MVWDGIIACYLFLAGLGAGAFALAAIAGFIKPNAVKFRIIGYLIAPIAVGVGTILLMVDARAGLMNPLRFFGLLTNFSSIMTWGVVILIAFMIVSVIALIIMLVKKRTPRALDIIGIICAVAVAVYTGLLLGDSPGFPLWSPVILPILFLISAASSGFAAVLVIAHAMKLEDVHAFGFLKKTGLAFPMLEAALIVVLLAVTASISGSAADAASASVANLISGTYAVAFWVGLVAIGLVLPFCIELVQLNRSKMSYTAGDSHPSAPSTQAVGLTATATTDLTGLAMVGEIGVLIGGFMLRFLIIMAAVPLTLF